MQGGKNDERRHDSFWNTSQASKGFLISKHQKTNMRRKSSGHWQKKKHETKIL